MKLSSSVINKFLLFSQKKTFFTFRKMELSYILGNGNSEKISYISGGTYKALKIKVSYSSPK